MAKKEVKVTIFTKGEETLRLANDFVYLMEKHIYTSKTFLLDNSKHVSSKKYLKNQVEVTRKEDLLIRETITLVGAPQGWLKDNKYTEVCQDPDLQKR